MVVLEALWFLAGLLKLLEVYGFKKKKTILLVELWDMSYELIEKS